MNIFVISLQNALLTKVKQYAHAHTRENIKHKKTVVVQATVLRCSNVGLKLAS